jgi:hypothetical protein
MDRLQWSIEGGDEEKKKTEEMDKLQRRRRKLKLVKFNRRKVWRRIAKKTCGGEKVK